MGYWPGAETMTAPDPSLRFQAAVERPLCVVFRASDGRWEGHDYTVEVVTERSGLDGYDVVMDFRDLEAVLDDLLAPLQGRLLSDLGIAGPADLGHRLLQELAGRVPVPARLTSLALTDGHGRCLRLRA